MDTPWFSKYQPSKYFNGGVNFLRAWQTNEQINFFVFWIGKAELYLTHKKSANSMDKHIKIKELIRFWNELTLKIKELKFKVKSF